VTVTDWLPRTSSIFYYYLHISLGAHTLIISFQPEWHGECQNICTTTNARVTTPTTFATTHSRIRAHSLYSHGDNGIKYRNGSEEKTERRVNECRAEKRWRKEKRKDLFAESLIHFIISANRRRLSWRYSYKRHLFDFSFVCCSCLWKQGWNLTQYLNNEKVLSRPDIISSASAWDAI
jgi:hypothetical protein